MAADKSQLGGSLSIDRVPGGSSSSSNVGRRQRDLAGGGRRHAAVAAAAVDAARDAGAAPGEARHGAPRAAVAAAVIESFWDMRGEQRRARQLPSSFDREVYDALVGGHGAAPPSDFGEDLADGDGVDADELPPPPLMVMPISGML
ncbi:hypothetical protein OsJ_04622 [Oryza sativa Japonica Group]|uniref:Uncharacterized protein n=1 Tax=Oryza sativa subsp. japonica TaxID=39947 RepID=A3A149_ORYSJ|nr:hypothetical protein OsJ_04622 [Oryza sativa Japonica Group]